MEAIPWQALLAGIGTPVLAGIGWLGKKLWTLLETHAERRTKAVEAIAPSIKATFDEMKSHVTSHADEHAKAVEKAEANIIATVNTARTSIVESIELSKRLERLEAAAFRPKDPEESTVLERSDPRTVRNPSVAQSIRESRPSIVGR